MKTTILALIFPLLNSISIYCQVKQCEGEYARKNSYDVTNISDTILVGGWASLYLSVGEKYLFNKKIDLHEGYVSKISVIDSSIYLGISKNESNYPNPSIIVFNRNLNKKHELFLDKTKGVFVTEIIKCDSNLLIGTDNDLILYSLNTNKSKRINVPIKDTYKNTNKSKQQYIGAILEWNDSLIIAINSLIYIADKNMGYKRFLFNCKSLEYDPSYGDNSYYIKSILIRNNILYACNSNICFKFNLRTYEANTLAKKNGVFHKMMFSKDGIIVSTWDKGFYLIKSNYIFPINYAKNNIMLHGIYSYLIKNNDIIYTNNTKGIYNIKDYSFTE